MSDLIAREFNLQRGRILGLIDSWGEDERRTQAMKQIFKSLSYDSEKAVKQLVDELVEARVTEALAQD
jgi:GTP-sensing pleiotropic transcriptional regulator CodY